MPVWNGLQSAWHGNLRVEVEGLASLPKGKLKQLYFIQLFDFVIVLYATNFVVTRARCKVKT